MLGLGLGLERRHWAVIGLTFAITTTIIGPIHDAIERSLNRASEVTDGARAAANLNSVNLAVDQLDATGGLQNANVDALREAIPTLTFTEGESYASGVVSIYSSAPTHVVAIRDDSLLCHITFRIAVEDSVESEHSTRPGTCTALELAHPTNTTPSS